MVRPAKIFLSCLALVFVSFYLFSKTEVLFSPEDRPAKKLIALIKEATRKIHAAVYMITDKRVAQALVSAKERGVDVQVVTDKATMHGLYGKGTFLREQGVDVYEYQPPSKASNKKDQTKAFYRVDPLMHNKFAIIDNKTWTGSFNWTRSGDYRNKENVVILDEEEVREKYQKKFDELKEESSKSRQTKAREGHSGGGYTMKSLLKKITTRLVEVFSEKNKQ